MGSIDALLLSRLTERGDDPGRHAPGDGALHAAGRRPDGTPDRGPGPDPEQVRIGEVVAQQSLEDAADEPQRRTDGEGEEQSRHADAPHDRLGLPRGLVEGIDTDLAGENPEHLSGRHRYRTERQRRPGGGQQPEGDERYEPSTPRRIRVGAGDEPRGLGQPPMPGYRSRTNSSSAWPARGPRLKK